MKLNTKWLLVMYTFLLLLVMASLAMAGGANNKAIALGLGDSVVVSCTIGTPHIVTTQYGRGVLSCSD